MLVLEAVEGMAVDVGRVYVIPPGTNMAIRNLETTRDYLTLLRADDAEIQNLYQNFLIRVTQFFRDAEAFEALKEKVFPAIVDGRTLRRTIISSHNGS